MLPRTKARRARIAVSLLVGFYAVATYQAVSERDLPLGWSSVAVESQHRSALSPALDADRDGLADAEERELARRYAPVVTLHGEDRARPASVAWLLARALRGLAAKPGLLRLGGYGEAIRRGSSDPRDWVTYVHVFPAASGGVLIQYWFFYPFNQAPLFFKHEGDWEHVTVELDAGRRPLGLWAARHQDNAPGRFRAWLQLRREAGTHPEVLSALGTHASYFDLDELPFYDRAGRCPDLQGPCDHLRWRTWQAGGLQQMGELQAPLDGASMTHAGPWGRGSLWPTASAPFGPAFQRSWCSRGKPACPMYGAF